MPTYVYKFVETGQTIEVQQAFTDDTLTEYDHPETGTPMPVKKVFQPVGVTFKGSGFFKNDNRSSSSPATSDTSSGSSDTDKASKSSNGSSSDSSSSSGSDSTKSSSSDSGTSKSSASTASSTAD